MDVLSNTGFGPAAKTLERFLARTFVAAMMAGLAAAALLLVARRVAGGLLEPLTAASLATTGLLLAGVGILIRRHLCRELLTSADHRQRQFGLVTSGITTFATLALAGAVSLPETPRTGLLALWIPIIAGECGWLVRLLSETGRSVVPKQQPKPELMPDKPEIRTDRAQAAYTPQVLPQDISQHIQRAITEDQRDACFGWVRADFQSKQRTESIHLAFCPPFLATPTVDIQQLDGPDLQIKTAQVLPYGARLELRLGRACDKPVSATIGFTAVEEKKNGIVE
jgi:hypothetical protein